VVWKTSARNRACGSGFRAAGNTLGIGAYCVSAPGTSGSGAGAACRVGILVEDSAVEVLPRRVPGRNWRSAGRRRKNGHADSRGRAEIRVDQTGKAEVLKGRGKKVEGRKKQAGSAALLFVTSPRGWRPFEGSCAGAPPRADGWRVEVRFLL